MHVYVCAKQATPLLVPRPTRVRVRAPHRFRYFDLRDAIRATLFASFDIRLTDFVDIAFTPVNTWEGTSTEATVCVDLRSGQQKKLDAATTVTASVPDSCGGTASITIVNPAIDGTTDLLIATPIFSVIAKLPGGIEARNISTTTVSTITTTTIPTEPPFDPLSTTLAPTLNPDSFIFAGVDADSDGAVTAEEAEALGLDADAFAAADADGDGALNQQETNAAVDAAIAASNMTEAEAYASLGLGELADAGKLVLEAAATTAPPTTPEPLPPTEELAAAMLALSNADKRVVVLQSLKDACALNVKAGIKEDCAAEVRSPLSYATAHQHSLVTRVRHSAPQPARGSGVTIDVR